MPVLESNKFPYKFQVINQTSKKSHTNIEKQKWDDIFNIIVSAVVLSKH